MSRRVRPGAVLALTLLASTGFEMRTARAPTLPRFDFTRAEASQGWQPAHDVSHLRGTPEGLEIEISGADPYLIGPARDYPSGTLLWLTVRIKSDQPGMGQVFYFQKAASEANSVRFPVRAGAWEEVRLPLPALGPGTQLRVDPPGTGGKAVLGFLRFQPRVLWPEPAWPRPAPPELNDQALSVQSGDLQLAHDGKSLAGFALRVAGKPMAIGLTRSLIGYVHDGQLRWVPLGAAATARQTKAGLRITASYRDPDGATWSVQQRFSSSQAPGAIDGETRVTVDHDRSVVFLPLLAILPGAGSFGAAKGQGLFAGLEYLENEPSSSEADVVGPASRRQVPDSLKITFPLMAVQAQDRYVGLIWQADPSFSALFDSPDRLFGSGGHVMGLLFPGSDGSSRAEGSLLPYDGQRLPAGKPLTLRATLIGGRGESLVPAVQQYVRLRGLPPIPRSGLDAPTYLRLAARGWLDSKIRVGDRYRHAAWPGFEPSAVADAPIFMEWLARQTADPGLALRLTEAARAAIALVRPEDYGAAHVSHLFPPVAPLIYGHVAQNARRAAERGRQMLSRFEPDGSVLYKQTPGHPDFGKTHDARDANGLTAQVVSSLLEAATLSGDPQLIAQGLRVLRALDKFTNGVPRGAQTWEVPLHTPDILAAAHLVRAYLQGYELTGEARLLDQARYWAWTGVPFVYLVNPATHPVGRYATIAVLGATHWTAPVWLGLPVQWCGLVYADALYRLAPCDPQGPWEKLADGITTSGIQQTWPPTDVDLPGLLPDSYVLRAQTRQPPPINPGTVMADAIRLYHQPAIYSFHSFRANGVLVHAPGALSQIHEEAGRVSFTAEGWLDRPYHVLIAGLKQTPRVLIDGREAPVSAPNEYLPSEGRLILTLQGKPAVEIRLK